MCVFSALSSNRASVRPIPRPIPQDPMFRISNITEDFEGIRYACGCHILNRPIKQRVFAVHASAKGRFTTETHPSRDEYMVNSWPPTDMYQWKNNGDSDYWPIDEYTRDSPVPLLLNVAPGEFQVRPYYEDHYNRCCLCRLSAYAGTSWQPYFNPMMEKSDDLLRRLNADNIPRTLDDLRSAISANWDSMDLPLKRQSLETLEDVIRHFARISMTREVRNGNRRAYDSFRLFDNKTLPEFLKASVIEARRQFELKFNKDVLRDSKAMDEAIDFIRNKGPDEFNVECFGSFHDIVVHACLVPNKGRLVSNYPIRARSVHQLEPVEVEVDLLTTEFPSSEVSEVSETLQAALSGFSFFQPELEHEDNIGGSFEIVNLRSDVQGAIVCKLVPGSGASVGIARDCDMFVCCYVRDEEQQKRSRKRNREIRESPHLPIQSLCLSSSETETDMDVENNVNGSSSDTESELSDDESESEDDVVELDNGLAENWKLLRENAPPAWTCGTSTEEMWNNILNLLIESRPTGQSDHTEGGANGVRKRGTRGSHRASCFLQVYMWCQSGKASLISFMAAAAYELGYPSIVVIPMSANAQEIRNKLVLTLSGQSQVDVKLFTDLYDSKKSVQTRLIQHLKKNGCVIVNIYSSSNQIVGVEEAWRQLNKHKNPEQKRSPFVIMDEADALMQSQGGTIVDGRHVGQVPQSPEECEDCGVKAVEMDLYDRVSAMNPVLKVVVSATMKKLWDAAKHGHFFWKGMAEDPTSVAFFDHKLWAYDPERDRGCNEDRWVHRGADLLQEVEIEPGTGKMLRYKKGRSSRCKDYWTKECEIMYSRYWKREVDVEAGNIFFVRICNMTGRSETARTRTMNNYLLAKHISVQERPSSRPTLFMVMDEKPHILCSTLSDSVRNDLMAQGWRLGRGFKEGYLECPQLCQISDVFELELFRNFSKVLCGWSAVSRSVSINTKYNRITHAIIRVCGGSGKNGGLHLNEIHHILLRGAGWTNLSTVDWEKSDLITEIMTDRNESRGVSPTERIKKDVAYGIEIKKCLEESVGNASKGILSSEAFKTAFFDAEFNDELNMEATRNARTAVHRAASHSRMSRLPSIHQRRFSSDAPIRGRDHVERVERVADENTRRIRRMLTDQQREELAQMNVRPTTEEIRQVRTRRRAHGDFKKMHDNWLDHQNDDHAAWFGHANTLYTTSNFNDHISCIIDNYSRSSGLGLLRGVLANLKSAMKNILWDIWSATASVDRTDARSFFQSVRVESWLRGCELLRRDTPTYRVISERHFNAIFGEMHQYSQTLPITTTE